MADSRIRLNGIVASLFAARRGPRAGVAVWLRWGAAAACIAPVAVLAQSSVPGPPTGVTATVVGTSVTISWSPPASGLAVTGYVVTASALPGGPLVASVEIAAPPLVSAAVPPGTYHIRVIARNAAGHGPASDEITVTVGGAGGGCRVAPDPPGNLSAAVNGSQIVLSWHASAGACPDTTYSLIAGSTPGATDIAQVSAGARTSLEASAPRGTYYLRVLAVSSGGVSPASNEVVVSVGGSGGPAAFRVPSDTAAPLWFEIEQGGYVLDVFGTRGPSGEPAVLARAVIRDAAGNSSASIEYSAAGVPVRISESSGLEGTIVTGDNGTVELRFTLDDGSSVTVPLSLSGDLFSAGDLRPAEIDTPHDDDVGADRIVRVTLTAGSCGIPDHADVFGTVGTHAFLNGRRLSGTDTFEFNLGREESTSPAQSFCSAVRALSQGQFDWAEFTKRVGEALPAYCGRMRSRVTSCLALAAALVAAAPFAPYLEPVCEEPVVEALDWWGWLQRQSATVGAVSVQLWSRVDGQVKRLGSVSVPRTGGLQTVSYDVGPTSLCAIGPPRNLVATSSGTTVRLSWLPPSFGTPTTYIIEVGTAPGNADLGAAPTGRLDTGFETILGVGTYYVRVRAAAGPAVGAPSNEVPIIVSDGFDAPRNLRAQVVLTNDPPGCGFPVGQCVALEWEPPLMPLVNTYFVEVGSRPGASDYHGGDYANYGGGLVGGGSSGNLGNRTSIVIGVLRPGANYIRLRARFHEPLTGRLFHLGGTSNEVVVVRPDPPP